MEKDFAIVRDGSTLTVVLDNELSVSNAPALTEELSKYRGQGIEKIVFDATGLVYLSSSGIRTIFFAYQDLGGKPEIVFMNCAQEIYDVLDHVGLSTQARFEESPKMKEDYRKRHLCNLGMEEMEQHVKERKKGLDNFSANNDVVCYSMKIGQNDD